MQVKVLEDALVAELSSAACGGLVASRTGLLLQRLEGHAHEDADLASAYPFQVASTHNLCRPLSSQDKPAILCTFVALYCDEKTWDAV